MNDSIGARPASPDLTLGGLRLWVHGRQFPQAQDFWDANWLTVTAQCDAANASVQVRGPIIHLSELDRWCAETAGLADTLAGEARLVCLEQERR